MMILSEIHVPPAYNKRFMPLKRYIRNDGFDFPDKTIGRNDKELFQNNRLNLKKRLLICSNQLYALVLRGEIFPCPELILSLAIDFMTKPTECLQVRISFLRKTLYLK